MNNPSSRRRSSSKKRAVSNQIGAEGEAAFRLVAIRHGLLPTKLDEDVGLDFLCQVQEAPGSSGVSRMTGAVLGASVRTSASDDARVTLNPADASILLGASFPV